jgi:branched-chain amino acid transport system substrate-binding protein
MTVITIAGGAAVAHGKGSAVEPLPESFCSPLAQGATPPQFMIASDLPVRYFPRRAATLRMQDAIKYVLAQRGYKAGKYSIGYQACDDSSPQQGSGAFAKCAANARAYSANPSVIGLVGTWSSRCSGIELPILNRAAGGSLGLISPTNTNVGLTHAGAGTEPGEPGRYYPSGRRSFVRILAPDDFQGVADALLAKRLGARRVFVLDDREEYGLDVAGAFKRAAAKNGLRIAGTGSWTDDQTSFDTLVGRVAKTKPDAVFLAGYACPGCGKLVAGLRAGLGAKTPIIGSDGWSVFEDLAKAAGPAAEGMYVSIPGLPPGQLPVTGRNIQRRFSAEALGAGGPAYAAQAVAVLLDAIAASDGTRASVTRHLLAARVRGGIIGSFGFDRNGDTTFAPTMIFRIRGGKGKLDRVITPPPTLLS